MVFDQSVTIDIDIDGDKWLPMNTKISRSRYNRSDTVKMEQAVPDPSDDPDAVPEVGDDIYIELGPRSSITDSGNRDMVRDNGLCRVFTGHVTNVFDFNNGSWEIEATNYFLDLKTTEVTIAVDEPVTLSQLVSQVIDRTKLFAGIPDLEYTIDLSETTPIPYGFDRFSTSGEVSQTDILTTKEFTNVPADQILDTLAEMANAVWWIDIYNELQFGPTDTAAHKLSWVTDSSAGKQTPPYRSVRVIGDNVVSEEGWNRRRLVADEPGLAEASIDVRGELAEPTYVYKNRAIKTQKEAEQVRDRLLDELQQQQASGHVSVVGRPMVDILDVIEMPDRFARTAESPAEDAGEREAAQYVVQSVEHRLNGEDGYTTRIECGGLAGRYNGPILEYAGPNDDVGTGQMILSTEQETEDTE